MPTKDELQRENTKLKKENESLRARLDISEHSAGIRAECHIREWVRGTMSPGKTDEFDLRSASGHRLEIKYAHINKPSPNSLTLRWTWRNPLGNQGAKRYDRLILLGEVDERYAGDYRDPDPEYVVFDIPFRSVASLTGAASTINLTTNPNGAKGIIGQRLFGMYAVTTRELRQRYGKGK